jgi:hypothetical protein
MKTLTLAPLLVLLVMIGSVGAQEPKKIPSDSVEIETRGCLKGRVFTATAGPEGEGVSRGPDVLGRHFRVAGKRDVMDLVKKYDGQWVQIVGIVRKADLGNQGIGMPVGRGRVTIGAPGGDPTRMNPRASSPTMAVMDLTSVRFLLERCPLQ